MLAQLSSLWRRTDPPDHLEIFGKERRSELEGRIAAQIRVGSAQFRATTRLTGLRARHGRPPLLPQTRPHARAFGILDTDGNGLVDARETLGALAVLSKGHLTERLRLLFDIFDLNKGKEMQFDECFMMLRRTMAGMRKMVGIVLPPERVIHNMTKQIWKLAKRHRQNCIVYEDWFNWWSADSSIRSALKMVTWKPEDWVCRWGRPPLPPPPPLHPQPGRRHSAGRWNRVRRLPGSKALPMGVSKRKLGREAISLGWCDEADVETPISACLGCWGVAPTTRNEGAVNRWMTRVRSASDLVAAFCAVSCPLWLCQCLTR